MLKFTDMEMWIRMEIPAYEASWMRIHMQIPVHGYPPMCMRIFVIFLNNGCYYQKEAAFVTG